MNWDWWLNPPAAPPWRRFTTTIRLSKAAATSLSLPAADRLWSCKSWLPGRVPPDATGQLSPGPHRRARAQLPQSIALHLGTAKPVKCFRRVFKAVLLGQLPGPFALTGALTPRITGRRNTTVFVTIRARRRRLGVAAGAGRDKKHDNYGKKLKLHGDRKSTRLNSSHVANSY